MKQLMTLCMIIFTLPVFAGYEDGIISVGESEMNVVLENTDSLIVDGGEVYSLSANGNSSVNVKSTTPLDVPYWYPQTSEDFGGLIYVSLSDNSHLTQIGGDISQIEMYDNSTVELKGGYTGTIWNYQDSSLKSMDIYCKEDWSWIENPFYGITGIVGHWYDGTAFNINFINWQLGTYIDDTWKNINIITPEPTSLILLGLGGALICRKR